MRDVTDDDHSKILEAVDTELERGDPGPLGEHLPHGETVDERLGRVLVPPVARVDDTGPAGPAGHSGGGAGRGVSHDDGVDAHGLDRLHRVAAATHPS